MCICVKKSGPKTDKYKQNHHENDDENCLVSARFFSSQRVSPRFETVFFYAQLHHGSLVTPVSASSGEAPH